MSNGKQNNYENWKSKLDNLDSLPGENMPDKNEEWEKLYARLGGKKRSKKAVFYWAAAACILFALMIPSLYFKNNNHQLSNTQMKKNNIESDNYRIKNSSNKIIDKKDSALISRSALSANDQIKTEMTSPKKIKKNIYEKQMNLLRLPDTISTKNLLAETKSNSLSPIDTFSSLATSIPTKKKLKVVHINELGDPVEALPDIVRNTDKHSFQFKIASQGIYINPTIASNTPGVYYAIGHSLIVSSR
ncbi:MAG TPA: hypothetical protein VIJ95_18220 [Hanamia sp.]